MIARGTRGTEDAEPVAQPGEHLLDGHAAQPDSCQLKSERDAVEPPAELDHRRGVPRGEVEVRDGGARPLGEQRDGVAVRRLGVVGGQLERGDQQRVLVRRPERLPAGGE